MQVQLSVDLAFESGRGSRLMSISKIVESISLKPGKRWHC